MFTEWEQEMEGPNEDPLTPVELNKTIWRLNEASMFMSRFLQYQLCGEPYWFPDEARQQVYDVAAVTRDISRALQDFEYRLAVEQGEVEACLECIEERDKES